MTNVHKLKDPWAMSSLVNDWTRCIYGPTDPPTDMFRGGHNNEDGHAVRALLVTYIDLIHITYPITIIRQK